MVQFYRAKWVARPFHAPLEIADIAGSLFHAGTMTAER